MHINIQKSVCMICGQSFPQKSSPNKHSVAGKVLPNPRSGRRLEGPAKRARQLTLVIDGLCLCNS